MKMRLQLIADKFPRSSHLLAKQGLPRTAQWLCTQGINAKGEVTEE